jgi:hypothetical protein
MHVLPLQSSRRTFGLLHHVSSLPQARKSPVLTASGTVTPSFPSGGLAVDGRAMDLSQSAPRRMVARDESPTLGADVPEEYVSRRVGLPSAAVGSSDP